MDAGEDGWERLEAGLAEGERAKEADKRERTIISHRWIFSYSLCSFNVQMVASHDLLHG